MPNKVTQEIASGTQKETRPVSVGDEIRTIRKARGITLKQLSKLAGCSAAYLSRIERGEARISIDLLTTIGDALKVDPKWFFPNRSGEGILERTFVVRAKARRPLSRLYSRSTEELGFEDELLSSSLAGDCYMMLTRFPRGADCDTESREGFVYEGEQHGFVIEGSMELTLGDEVIIINAGDSFSYPTEIPHRLRNAIEEETVVIFTMTPVRINW
jgi:transcriptional regulator with XRE-family HTH domain